MDDQLREACKYCKGTGEALDACPGCVEECGYCGGSGVSAAPAPPEQETVPLAEFTATVDSLERVTNALAEARGFTDEDVERAARAAHGSGVGAHVPWERLAYDGREHYRAQVRAVLAAVGPKGET